MTYLVNAGVVLGEEKSVTGNLDWDTPIGPRPELPEPVAADPGPRLRSEPANLPKPIPTPAPTAIRMSSLTAVLPHNEDAERGVLGAILLDHEKVLPFCVKKTISSDSFYTRDHHLIYAAMLEMQRTKKHIDVLTLADQLKKQRKLELVGGTAYINSLLDAIPTAAHAEYYIDMVRANHLLRKVGEQGATMIERANNGVESAADIIADIRMKLDGLNNPATAILLTTPLAELKRVFSGEDPRELLKSRYLSRGGALLLVAQTGVGKSSFVMQAAMTWALGRPFFEIDPARPLRTLIVQAENDAGDMAEMRDGVIDSMGLSEENKAAVMANIDTCFVNSQTGHAFGTNLRGLLASKSYDLLIIDPASAYLGGDSSQQKDVTEFCRNILNPILTEYGCGLILVHHTTKPPKNDEKSRWQGGDWAYLGAGSAEWCNWARAVINIEACVSPAGTPVYRLRLPKRGKRIGWRTEDGAVALTRWIAHARDPEQICWREADPDEIPLPTQQQPGQTRQGRVQEPKPPLEAYLPLAMEIIGKAPVQTSVFRAALDNLIMAGARMSRAYERALFDMLTKGENPSLAVTKKRVGLAQFIGLPEAILKVENEQKTRSLAI